ncbi:hypothetical protein AUEXF2481DRAFT_569610 [Aureobasidium subglaciale EXF-2481]|uniref:Uncharacterized protein n=1 Tax=Aureobasidium subglaciale (strain EXF-2481) TaxID=1043005 RepID=A0A074YUA7_AURSE|nr:uncharacterized protein AUEXF2481DRAFT_569610 [Aureobasidium subglaciale EXF-2481]KEQ90426.1 hypothetical protein AUEXF2481DRAFT_569610 [Aureobasidium subglaciale EXF-2481]
MREVNGWLVLYNFFSSVLAPPFLSCSLRGKLLRKWSQKLRKHALPISPGEIAVPSCGVSPVLRISTGELPSMITTTFCPFANMLPWCRSACVKTGGGQGPSYIASMSLGSCVSWLFNLSGCGWSARENPLRSQTWKSCIVVNRLRRSLCLTIRASYRLPLVQLWLSSRGVNELNYPTISLS